MSNILKTGLLLAVLTVMLVLLGGALGGQQGMMIAFFLALAMNFVSYWFSDESVLAHELSHVKNRDVLISTVAATLAGAITYLAHMAQWAAMFGGRGRDDDEGGSNPIAMIVLAILAPIAALLVQMAVSRSREFQADATGAKVAGKSWGLMKALEKLQMANQQMPMADATPATAHLFIVNPLSGQTLMRLFSTHPPLEERIARLRAMRI